MGNKKITPQIEERAKKFHKLWENGYSVIEASKELGISWGTVYEELQLYAEINQFPNKKKPSRLAYIRDYKARAKGLYIDKVQKKSEDTAQDKKASDKPKKENEKVNTLVDYAASADNTIDSKAINDSFDDIEDKCEYVIGLMSSKVEEYTNKIANLKEETV